MKMIKGRCFKCIPFNLTSTISFKSLWFRDFLVVRQMSLQLCACFCFSEVRLYLMILEKLEHYEKALGVLRSNLAGKHS